MSDEKTMKVVDFAHESTLSAFNAEFEYGLKFAQPQKPFEGFRRVEPARDHWKDNAEARRNSKHEELDDAGFELGFRLGREASEAARG